MVEKKKEGRCHQDTYEYEVVVVSSEDSDREGRIFKDTTNPMGRRIMTPCCFVFSFSMKLTTHKRQREEELFHIYVLYC